MSEKIFVGGGKKKGNSWFKVTINPDKIKDHIQEYQGHKYVKLDINVLDEPDKYGKDVKITIDQFDPEKKKPKEDYYTPDGGNEVKEDDSQEPPF